MKLHYSNILLFFLPLNIWAYNKNKSYIAPHIPTTTTRVLSECDIQKSTYDSNPEMKKVMENFDRQTSQRFEEYNERMIEKRKKCKEQCDKDIQEIILKDKIDKSLEEKVEKGCLKCGCGLGGVAAGVGIFGSIAVNELKKAAMAIAIKDAIAEGLVAGETARIQASIKAVILGIKSKFRIDTLGGEVLESILTAQKYDDVSLISESIYMQYKSTCLPQYVGHGADLSKPICHTVYTLDFVQGKVHVPGSLQGSIKKALEKIVAEAKSNAVSETANVTTRQTAVFESRNIAAVDATYASYQTAIVASVVAILVIVLVMLIIYLILRYRRKKKMNKKLQYTKLLNQ
ncbi:PIR protein, putative [Plasmodium sp. gorilla clade G1]|nr:PIR protein, putative [Plasmodium sp. gorilla clade G1]